MSSPSPKFIVQNGLRKVLPYYHTNSTFAKGRWLNRTVVDVLSDEFRTRDEQYYINEIKNQRIYIIRNNEKILNDRLFPSTIQNKDILNLTLHKHEPFIIHHDPIPIVYQDENLIVVNKPSSIPVHPTGKYFYNSLTEIMKSQLNISQIHTCHRLDKLTSGILVLAKTTELASQLQKQIKEKTVEKCYLARVEGKFPEEVLCEQPIANLDTKIGYNNAIKEKRPAITQFKRLKYNHSLDQSIVLCKPLTGRTHQIRIHLNFLDHAIVNDPLYGPDCSKIRKDYIMNDNFGEHYGLSLESFNELHDEFMDHLDDLKNDKHCEECGEVEFKDPQVEDLELWLHSYKYVFDKYEFETEQPYWTDI